MKRVLALKKNDCKIILSKGTYVLIIRCSRETFVEVGKLGGVKVSDKVFYLYVGSAYSKGGLLLRLLRHLRYSNKTLFWHIDYLLNITTGCEVRKIIVIPEKRVEHFIAKNLASKLNYVPKFGSSDCKCPSHLFLFSASELEKVLVAITNILKEENLKLKVISPSEVISYGGKVK